MQKQISMNDDVALLRDSIRDIKDFPTPGIVFKDITPILASGDLLGRAVKLFHKACEKHRPQKIIGIDARGFIFGAAVAYSLGIGFVPVRKQGKLPFATHAIGYALEYGSATVEIHRDAFEPGERVVIVDDLLATGGTAAAAATLVQQMGGELLDVQFLIELSFLSGRAKLGNLPVTAFIRY